MIENFIDLDLTIPTTKPNIFKIHQTEKGKTFGIIDNEMLFGIPIDNSVRNSSILNMKGKVKSIANGDKTRNIVTIVDDNDDEDDTFDIYSFYNYCDLGIITEAHIISGFSIKGFSDIDRKRIGMYLVPDYSSGNKELLLKIIIKKYSGELTTIIYDLINDQIKNDTISIKMKNKDLLNSYQDMLNTLDFADKLTDETIHYYFDKNKYDRIIFNLNVRLSKEEYDVLYTKTVEFNNLYNPYIFKRIGLKNIINKSGETTEFYDAFMKSLNSYKNK